MFVIATLQRIEIVKRHTHLSCVGRCILDWNFCFDLIKIRISPCWLHLHVLISGVSWIRLVNKVRYKIRYLLSLKYVPKIWNNFSSEGLSEKWSHLFSWQILLSKVMYKWGAIWAAVDQGNSFENNCCNTHQRLV